MHWRTGNRMQTTLVNWDDWSFEFRSIVREGDAVVARGWQPDQDPATDEPAWQEATNDVDEGPDIDFYGWWAEGPDGRTHGWAWGEPRPGSPANAWHNVGDNLSAWKMACEGLQGERTT